MSITDQLLKLHRVEQQLHSLRSRVDQAQRYLTAQTRQLDELKRRRDGLESQRRQVSATAHNLETEVEAAEQRIEKIRHQMNNAQTNKEYTALRTELSTVKIDKDKLESEALERMGEIDEIKKQIAESDVAIAEREKIRQVAENQYKQRSGEVSERLAELEQERSAASRGIPSDVLAEFDQLVEWNEGEAMAEVIEVDRRRMQYSCGVCNMSIPIENVSALLSAGTINRCPSCGRILYVGEEMRGSFEKRVGSR